jgi:hypothetical protein
MTQSQQNEDFLPSDDETDGTTDDEFDSLFDKSDGDSDSEAWLSDDEEQRPPEYYLTGASNLDVKQLRQRRYSLKT